MVLEGGMIWEAYSDNPLEVIIVNNDKQWIRHLSPDIDTGKIDQLSNLLSDLEEYKIDLPGLEEERIKHFKVKKSNHPD